MCTVYTNFPMKIGHSLDFLIEEMNWMKVHNKRDFQLFIVIFKFHKHEWKRTKPSIAASSK